MAANRQPAPRVRERDGIFGRGGGVALSLSLSLAWLGSFAPAAAAAQAQPEFCPFSIDVRRAHTIHPDLSLSLSRSSVYLYLYICMYYIACSTHRPFLYNSRAAKPGELLAAFVYLCPMPEDAHIHTHTQTHTLYMYICV